MDYLDPALFAIPLYVSALVVERRVVARRRVAGKDLVGHKSSDSWASLRMGFVSLATVGVLNLGVFALAEWLWQWRITDLGNTLLGWVVAMIGWDFAYYWLHRFEHESRFFWAAHVNHHSSRRYNLTTALRQPWLPILVLVVFPPLALLGVRPWMIMVAGGFNLIYQFWIHTEAVDRMPRWFEFVFNTPSHHRVHHGSNPQYLDRNHGGVLIVWDRMFGTFEPEVERVRYGLTKDNPPDRIWPIFSHEVVAIWRDVRQATSWSDRFGYTFRGPGWAPAAGSASGSGSGSGSEYSASGNDAVAAR